MPTAASTDDELRKTNVWKWSEGHEEYEIVHGEEGWEVGYSP